MCDQISDKTELVVKIEKLTNKIKKQCAKNPNGTNWSISADFKNAQGDDDRAVNLWLLNQLKPHSGDTTTSNELLYALLVSTIVANFVPSINAHGEACRFVDRFEHHPVEGIEEDKTNGRWPLVGKPVSSSSDGAAVPMNQIGRAHV